MALNKQELKALLFEQECSLLHDEFSDEVEKLLGPELWEIAADGVIRSRQEICMWLVRKSPHARWDIRDFKVMCLSEHLALSTYWAKMLAPRTSASLGAMHSSLWKQNPEGLWQMVFHQSTKVESVGDA
tara:strand:+ start:23388 stop:23774 length:387 start_codon:yes stop_codon:yes gene_type:complete